MTDKHTLVDEYLIRKGGYFYRPKSQGYTSSPLEAGVYTLKQAIRETHPNGPDGPRDGLTYHPRSDFPEIVGVTSMANRITTLEAEKALLVAHLRRMITAVTEFGPHCGFWDWRDDASAFLATLAKARQSDEGGA